MNKRLLKLAVPLMLLPAIALSTLEKSELDTRKISRTVAYSLPVFHLNQLPLDEEVSQDAFSLFIEDLDPARSFFLQSDIDRFKEKAPKLGRLLRKGDISFAHEVYNTLLERMSDRIDYTEKLLETGFDTEVDEEFVWDRKDAPWPQNQTEWDELWRKRIKNEYITRLVSKEVYASEEDEETDSTTAALQGFHQDPITQTNTTEATETDSTDESVKEFDQEAEDFNLTPEDFILKRYSQLKQTMGTFDEEMLLQRYLTAFTHVYDPHSDYMSPSSVEDFNINMKLSLVGIGAMLRPDEGTARIVRIIPGGPADKDGRLQAGDKIIAVAQENKDPVSILHWPLYKSVRLIRGELNTKVTLTIIPAADRTGSRTRKIELVRDEVKLEEQAASSDIEEMGNHRLGVITIPDFYADFKATQDNEATARRLSTDVKKLVAELKEENIDGLIIDLRNNGGGSLVEAIDTAGLFITSGPIVQVKERSGVQVLPDEDPAVDYTGPLIVLVNRLSASASEILAAALQDYNRAIIVGDERTHGKGTVQTLMPLGRTEKSRRGSLKLTTAGFYRINGDSTQLKGVVPDIIIPSYFDVMELGEDTLEHAFPWDRIRPAMYRKLNGPQQQYIATLQEKSDQRLKSNKEFKAYLSKRERLKKRFETRSISLSLTERLKEAEAEKELDDIQHGSLLEEQDKENTNDLVLKETLAILADLAELQTQPTQAELALRADAAN